MPCWLAVAIIFVLTGPHLRHYADTVVNTCAAHNDCVAVTAHFHALAHFSNAFSILVSVVPVLFGIFWGAPLVARELEAGTYRLAWTQSRDAAALDPRAPGHGRSRGRRAHRTPQPGGDLVAEPRRPAQPQPLQPTSSARDVVPAPLRPSASRSARYSARSCGGRSRRWRRHSGASPSCGTVVQQFVRPNLLAPLRLSQHFRAPLYFGNSNRGVTPPNPADWVRSDQVLSPSGKVLGQYGGIGPHGLFRFKVSSNGSAVFSGVGRCPNLISPPPGHLRPQYPTPAQARFLQAEIQRCVDSFHLREVLTFQPTSHYWPLQWLEAGIFAALALALGAACIWWVRRRLP